MFRDLIASLRRIADPIGSVCGRIRIVPGEAANDDAEFESKHPRDKNGEFAKGRETSSAPQASPQEQYDAVVAQHKGKPTWMKAPNGQPTKLTERQWVQTRTQAFKDWFGDWENDPEHASKVIDENGEPLVVYHGTKDKFNVFTGGDNNNSSWFAEKIGYAREYAGDPEDGNVDAWIKHCFLNVKNPFDMRDGENTVDGYAEISKTRHDGGEASEAEISKIARLLGTTSDDVKKRFDNRQIWEITQSREFAERLRKLGYDGIKFIEVGDPTWATFDPNQIKSATDNTGAFDPNKQDVRDSAFDASPDRTRAVKPTRTVDPNLIVTVNGITDRDKFERIAADFKAHGWNCRPVLAWSDDGKRWIAYTGSHRTFAARAAGIDVPIFEIPSSAMQKAFAILRRNGENPERLKDNTNEVNSLWMFKKLADEYGLKEFEIPKMLMEIEVK